MCLFSSIQDVDKRLQDLLSTCEKLPEDNLNNFRCVWCLLFTYYLLFLTRPLSLNESWMQELIRREGVKSLSYHQPCRSSFTDRKSACLWNNQNSLVVHMDYAFYLQFNNQIMWIFGMSLHLAKVSRYSLLVLDVLLHLFSVRPTEISIIYSDKNSKLIFLSFSQNRYLIKFLAKLTEHQDANKMTPGNIAIVLGPNLLWTHSEEWVHVFRLDYFIHFCWEQQIHKAI